MDPWVQAIKNLSDACFAMAEQGMTREDVKRIVDQEYDKIGRNAAALAYGQSIGRDTDADG